jgi:pyrroline-5-carboxylate reductase
MASKSPKERSENFGVIGLGRMGRCLVQGLLSTFPREKIFFTTKHAETAQRVASELGITACPSNRDLTEKCGTVLLGVKPQNALEVLGELRGVATKNHLFVSIVASITTTQMEQGLGGEIPIIRAMPNTPAFVKAAITAACLGSFAKESDWQKAANVFTPVGKFVRVDEKQMDAVTGLSGCGPAYFYVILESLTEAGIKVGLSRELASQLASQTMLGSAKMLQETGKHPAALKDEVTTPAGCTIDGLMALEEGRLRVTLIKAVVQATERARALARPVIE